MSDSPEASVNASYIIKRLWKKPLQRGGIEGILGKEQSMSKNAVGNKIVLNAEIVLDTETA